MTIYCQQCGGLVAGFSERTYSYPCRCGWSPQPAPSVPPLDALDFARRIEALEREIARLAHLVPPENGEDGR